MLSAPTDLSEPTLLSALAAGWSLQASDLTYRPVGFGSHHWELTDDSGTRWFVTVDDLRGRRRTSDEPLGAAFRRLSSALAAAQALRASGRDFVVAPLRPGDPAALVSDCWAVAVYPFVTGSSFGWGSWTPELRDAVLQLVAAVHAAPVSVRECALVEDYAIPLRSTVVAALDGLDDGLDDRLDDRPDLGPYERPAAELLTSHATVLRRELARYDALVSGARVQPPDLVLTHGEPHPGNTMRTGDRWLLIDWDTALVAPAERDLWALDPGDGSLFAAYAAATGHVVRADLLELYRLRWDLSEVAAGVARFREPHGSSADDVETWTILDSTVRSMANDSGG